MARTTTLQYPLTLLMSLATSCALSSEPGATPGFQSGQPGQPQESGQRDLPWGEAASQPANVLVGAKSFKLRWQLAIPPPCGTSLTATPEDRRYEIDLTTREMVVFRCPEPRDGGGLPSGPEVVERSRRTLTADELARVVTAINDARSFRVTDRAKCPFDGSVVALQVDRGAGLGDYVDADVDCHQRTSEEYLHSLRPALRLLDGL